MAKFGGGNYLAVRLFKYVRIFLTVVEKRGTYLKRSARCFIFLSFLAFAQIANASDLVKSETFYFNLPQQRADHSLTHVAEIANITLIFPYDKLKSVTANAIDGDYSAKAAVEQLMLNTGYDVVSVGLGGQESISIAKKSLGGAEIMKRLKKSKIATAIMSLAAATTFSAGVSAQETGAIELEEILVTGIRSSLERADAIKENANSLVDAISAEDIGKFPDTNVAESLQRITGVAITRSRGGEGQAVTVRGLGEAFNGVFYNGRLIATEAQGREFNFDVIASELISSAKVYKSSEANRPSGSLGGQVNVESAKPFDSPGFKSAFSVAGQHDELASDTGPRLSGVVSNTWGNWGALASVSYQDRSIRNDIHESILAFSFDVDTNTNTAYAIGGAPAGANVTKGRVSSWEQISNMEDRERIGATAAFQYQPSDDFNATFDILYSSLESPGTGSAIGVTTAAAGNFLPGSVIVNPDTGTVTSFSLRPSATASPNVDLLSRNTNTDAETTAFGANFEWKPRDNFTLVGDLAYSTAEGSRSQLRSGEGSGQFFIGLVRYAALDFEQRAGDDIPTISIRVPDSRTPGDPNSFNPNANLVPLDQVPLDTVRSHFSRESDNFIDDEILSARLDGEWKFSDRTSLKSGIYLTSQTKDVKRFNNNPTQGVLGGNSVFLRDHDPAIFDAFVASGGGAVNQPGNFLGDFSGGSVTRFPAIPAEVFQALLANDGFVTGVGLTSTPGRSLLDTAFRPANSLKVEEDVIAAYAQLNHETEFAGKPVRVNVGLRIEQTDVTSSSATNQIDSYLPLGTQAGDGIQFGTTPETPISVDNDYTDVLPSVNVAFDLRENLILRGALSTTVTRPTLSSLSPSATITRQNIGSEALNSGNPLLEPTRSNNIDLSLEYYGDNFIGSAAIFHKDIDDFVTNGATFGVPITIPNGFAVDGTPTGPITVGFEVLQPLNASSAEISGLEFAGRYQWENGFGVGANITLVDSEQTTNGVETDLDDVSDESYNFFAFYETDRIQARVALNHRGEYETNAIVINDGAINIVDDFTTIDASFAYKLSDSYEVYLEGINLTSENSQTFSGERDFIRAFEDFGARYNFGIRGSF